MTVLRAMLALITAGAAVATAALLGWPGWSYTPLGVVVAAASVYLLAARRRDPHANRVDAAMVVPAVVLTVAATVIALVGVDDPDHAGVDRSITATTAETVRALFTFGPDDYTTAAAQRRQEVLAPRLTGRLLADYRSQGPNVVLPAAVESGASLATTVQAVGVGDSRPDTVRLLVFATEQITVPTATPPTSTVPIVRWAVMRRVGNDWRLADIYPAGIGG